MRFYELTNDAVLQELGQRIRVLRQAANLTQGQLADQAGVARSTVQKLEQGATVQLSGLLKLLRVFGRLDALDVVFAPPPPTPLAELDRQQRAHRERVRRARSATNKADGDGAPFT